MNIELKKWKKEIEEISNNVWKVRFVHELGPSVEKIGTNLNQLEAEIAQDAIKMNKQIEEKLKSKYRS